MITVATVRTDHVVSHPDLVLKLLEAAGERVGQILLPEEHPCQRLAGIDVAIVNFGTKAPRHGVFLAGLEGSSKVGVAPLRVVLGNVLHGRAGWCDVEPCVVVP